MSAPGAAAAAIVGSQMRSHVSCELRESKFQRHAREQARRAKQNQKKKKQQEQGNHKKVSSSGNTTKPSVVAAAGRKISVCIQRVKQAVSRKTKKPFKSETEDDLATGEQTYTAGDEGFESEESVLAFNNK